MINDEEDDYGQPELVKNPKTVDPKKGEKDLLDEE